MALIDYEGQSLEIAEGQTVLDALLNAGIDVPHGCCSGVCQSCLMQAQDGTDLSAAQKGLSDAQKALNFFLACQCEPSASLAVTTAATERIPAEIVDKQALSSTVWLLKLRVQMTFLAGQFVTVIRDDQLARSYSIASVPDESGVIDLHIRRYPDGQFSSWVADEAAVGDSLQLQGPLGTCVYTPCVDQPMVLAGIGTGLAPLWGILQDAIAQGHQAPIHLLLAGRNTDDSFYWTQEMADWCAQHPQVRCTRVAEQVNGTGDNLWQGEVVQGDVYEYLSQHYPDLKGFRVFLCGAESFVKKMRRQCFMAGAGMKDISADAFVSFGA